MITLKEHHLDLPEMNGYLRYRLICDLETYRFYTTTCLNLWDTNVAATKTDLGFDINQALKAFNARAGL